MPRRRYQNGHLFKRGKSWVAQWWEDGHRRKKTLGLSSKMTKADAQGELASILGPLNSRDVPPSKSWMLADFLERVYLPFYRRKWKRSTAMTNEDRLQHHLVSEIRGVNARSLSSGAVAGFSRPEGIIWPLVQCGGSSSVGSEAGLRYGRG